MKHLLKNAAIFVALVLTVVFTGCKNPSSNDDGNTITKLAAPTNLVINSITDNTISCDVNFSFTYNGKTGIDGAYQAVLGYSTTNDSSKATYDTYNSTATVEAGENTRTVNYVYNIAPYFKPTSGKKYYFWLKVTSPAHNVSDSSWSNVAEFTYP